jgi:uncharacterized membrane protein
VLLVAVLCRYHPMSMSKLLPRVLGYISVRLRDNESRVTDACAILMSAISMHVLASMVLPAAAADKTGESDAQDLEKCVKVFEHVAISLLKDANAVGEGAARCMSALIFPTEFDGVSRPPIKASIAHASRILPYLRRLLIEAVTKMDGSTNYATFSPIFLQLHSACDLGNESHRRGGFSNVKECFAPLVESIFEAIEDTFKYAPRDDWMLRKRAIELFALMLDTFAMEDGSTEGAIDAARQYFRANVVRAMLCSQCQRTSFDVFSLNCVGCVTRNVAERSWWQRVTTPCLRFEMQQSQLFEPSTLSTSNAPRLRRQLRQIRYCIKCQATRVTLDATNVTRIGPPMIQQFEIVVASVQPQVPRRFLSTLLQRKMVTKEQPHLKRTLATRRQGQRLTHRAIMCRRLQS